MNLTFSLPSEPSNNLHLVDSFKELSTEHESYVKCTKYTAYCTQFTSG